MYNNKVYLRETIGSVVSQGYDVLDPVVVDDGATDGCVEAMQDMGDSRVRIVPQAKAARPGALHRVLDPAKGEFSLLPNATGLCRKAWL